MSADTERQHDEAWENYATRLRRMVVDEEPAPLPKERYALCDGCRQMGHVKRASAGLFCVHCFPTAVA